MVLCCNEPGVASPAEPPLNHRMRRLVAEGAGLLLEGLATACCTRGEASGLAVPAVASELSFLVSPLASAHPLRCPLPLLSGDEFRPGSASLWWTSAPAAA